MKLLRRTWANIDLDNLGHNYEAVRSLLPVKTGILGVVKADAYGHGAVPVAHALAEYGAAYLAVSNLEEAIQLRRSEIRLPILILGYTPAIYAEMMVFMDLTQEIHSAEYAAELNQQLEKTNYILNVHVKLDTGMTRIGYRLEEDLPRKLEALKHCAHLHVNGVFTHFSVADSLAPADVQYTKNQYEGFRKGVRILEDLGFQLEYRHCDNSGGSVLYPEYAMDMVRPGILLYGVHPSEATRDRIELRPVMSLYSTVAQIRRIPKGAEISYGRTFRAEKDMITAVIPIGYADGLCRSFSGKLSFEICGKTAPIVGRICMDMCMVDVTEIPELRVGERVTVFGGDPEGQTCDDLAELNHTIPYEILCGINKRIPRIYISGGKETEILQYIV